MGSTLRYAMHRTGRDGDLHTLEVELTDASSALRVTLALESFDGVPALRARTTVTNDGVKDVVLQAVSSLCTGAVVDGNDRLGDLDLLTGGSEWVGEHRWSRRPVRPGQLLPDLDLDVHGLDARGALGWTSRGTWSSGEWMPTAGLLDRDGGRALLWEVEHNGAWRTEIAQRRQGLQLALLGPTDTEHQWSQRLAPGASFTSVPASVAVSDAGLTGAIDALTRHRRASRRPHPDRDRMPVVFNDFMNTLMGDPTTEALLPLVAAAASAGAEIFCIDAGWYDEDGAWWDSVGEYLPSRTRFPGGIDEVLDAIRSAGMVPGLWLEPEVIGVRSPLAGRLPDDAFFVRSGVRVVEHGRHHLDLRHPAARAHLDAVVDRLVADHGIGFLKLDYNVNPGAGTEVDADSAGAGLLGHNRAHLTWLDGVLDRHADLVVENCGSGAMRADQAILSRLAMQSTSDQQDHLRYAAIAASAPAAMTPEQAANWAYPQPSMDPEEAAFALCNGILGRLYLAGRLDRMSAAQLDLVREAVRAHQRLRLDVARSSPVWPLGLPGWEDGWVALGLRTPDALLLTLWRRPGAPDDIALPLPGYPVDGPVETVFPAGLPAWPATWDAATGLLSVHATTPAPSARVLRLPMPGPTGALGDR